MIRHSCGSTIPPNVETYVRHLASCPEAHEEIGSWCRAIVTAVDYEARQAETPTETRDLTPAEMASMRYAGKSLRDIAAIAGVAPEMVRRRIAKWKTEGGL